MTGVLPALAAAATYAEVVGSRRGRVVHITYPGIRLTPTGRLRARGSGALCGQRSRALRRWPVDGRPLCRRCAAAVGTPSTKDLPKQLRADLVVASLHTARVEQTWLVARREALDLTQMRVGGERLGQVVSAARARLNAEPQRRPHLERALPRRLPTVRVRGRRPDPIDQLVGGLPAPYARRTS